MAETDIAQKADKKILVGDFKIGLSEKRAIKEVLDIGRISEGKKVLEFERMFAEFVGTKYSVLVSSGTAALIAGLNALSYIEGLKIKRGQKIITTPLTYIATSNAIVLSGFEPVYVDIDRDSLNISPENILSYLRQAEDISEYAMILPVHLMGFPCDMAQINSIANDHGLLVFEDSSQAHGSVYNGKKAGSLSLLSSFSFYIAHNIQVGEMGAVVTDNLKIANLIRQIKANGRVCDCPICTRHIGVCHKLRDYAGDADFDPRFTHSIIGYNFKTDEFSACLGICQLKKVEMINKARRNNVLYLNNKLKKFEELLQLPRYLEYVSYLAYPIIIKRPDIISRKYLREELERRGVETRPIFGCIPTQQPAYEYLKKEYEGRLPNAEYAGLNGFYIGCHQYLKKDDLDYVVYVFENILKGI